MKTELTTEQSNHLIELGVPFNKASICHSVASIGNGIKDIGNIEQQYIFKLEDILKILPKVLHKEGLTYDYNLEMCWQNDIKKMVSYL